MEQDYVVAYMWFLIADSIGDYFTDVLMEKLGEKMTPEQIAEAEIEATAWIEEHKN